jgi:CcmD family protein
MGRQPGLRWFATGLAQSALVASAIALLHAGVAQAQQAAQERAQSFRAVEGAVKEDVAGGPLLLMAYGAIWVLLLLYLFRLVRQQQRAEGDLQRLERVLARESGPERRAG